MYLPRPSTGFFFGYSRPIYYAHGGMLSGVHASVGVRVIHLRPVRVGVRGWAGKKKEWIARVWPIELPPSVSLFPPFPECRDPDSPTPTFAQNSGEVDTLYAYIAAMGA